MASAWYFPQNKTIYCNSKQNWNEKPKWKVKYNSAQYKFSIHSNSQKACVGWKKKERLPPDSWNGSDKPLSGPVQTGEVCTILSSSIQPGTACISHQSSYSLGSMVTDYKKNRKKVQQIALMPSKAWRLILFTGLTDKSIREIWLLLERINETETA